MVSWWYAAMASPDASTQDFSYIVLTILRSELAFTAICCSALTLPHRVLIASIRDKGQCPCPRCTMSISEVKSLGTPEDTVRCAGLIRLDDEEHCRTIRAARELILKYNHAVDSKDVEELLKAKSLTPTAVSDHSIFHVRQLMWSIQNAFSKKLGPLGFNIFKALLADFMHEVEIGVWKGLFIHLLRILEAHDKKTKTTMKEFNKR